MLAILVAVAVPPGLADSPVEARAATHTIFLDRDGATLRPGANDSRAETSTLVDHPTTIPPWTISDANWAKTVACVRDLWAPFDIDVTDVDPGADAPHVQVVLGGLPALLDMPATAAGVSPMRTDCGVIENSIVFAFPALVHDNPQLVCEILSQEIGHSFGLDHELEADDPMSYLPRSGPRTFQAKSVACGEFAARPCGRVTPACRPAQSSYDLLLDRLGPAVASLPDPTAGSSAGSGSATDEPLYGEPAGCDVGGGAGGAASFAVVALLLARRRRR